MVYVWSFSQKSGVASVANPSDPPKKLTRPRVHTNAPTIAARKKNQHMEHPKGGLMTILAFRKRVSIWEGILANCRSLCGRIGICGLLIRCPQLECWAATFHQLRKT